MTLQFGEPVLNKVIFLMSRVVIIRNAKLEDTKTINTLGQNVDEFATGKATVTFWPESILESAVQTDTVMTLVAEIEGNIAGFIIGNCNKSLRKVLIENLYVHPTYRRQGIGSKLAQALINEAGVQGYEYLAALVPPDDKAAIKTYQKVGFTPGEQFLWFDYSTSKRFRKKYASQ